MSKNNLKRLSREELLNMLIELTEENKNLKAQLEKAEDKLKKRTIKMRKAGSIAKAALELNDVFEAAQKAADQYLESVIELSEKTAKKSATKKTSKTKVSTTQKAVAKKAKELKNEE